MGYIQTGAHWHAHFALTQLPTPRTHACTLTHTYTHTLIHAQTHTYMHVRTQALCQRRYIDSFWDLLDLAPLSLSKQAKRNMWQTYN